MRVVVLNAGSSSLKGSLLDDAGAVTLARSQTDLGPDATVAANIDQAVRRTAAELQRVSPARAVGHRVVHGGVRLVGPVVVDEAVLREIEALREFAPLHNGIAAQVIRSARRLWPGLAQVAVFDTAFHAAMPEVAYRYPVPDAWYASWGIRRFGFHGISVSWAVQRAAAMLRRPASQLDLLVAHLGNGCSVTAVHAGRSANTSMGLTPLEGLMMGTRSGSIDPGIMLYVLRARGLSPQDLESTLDHRAGLLAVGGSADVRELEARAGRGDERARLALEMFAQRTAAGIAAMATALPRLDALVFTGGIGEHAGTVRRAIVARLGPLGIAPIEDVASAEDGPLSAPGAPVAILRIEAREDAMIAAEVERLLQAV
ncbi:MAG TPA: acetate/propionate family kinase [Candidatus Limnocylindrales bacterium]|nr:acetate/propionate family kinase [Candidatus Limnocylindrales bacterium]